MPDARPNSSTPLTPRSGVRWLFAAPALIGAAAPLEVRCRDEISPAVDVQAVWFDAGLASKAAIRRRPASISAARSRSAPSAPGAVIVGRSRHRGALQARWTRGPCARASTTRTRPSAAPARRPQPPLCLGLAYAIMPTVRSSLDYDLTRFKVHTPSGPL